jgi:outer membrane protein assembly factor BamA
VLRSFIIFLLVFQVIITQAQQPVPETSVLAEKPKDEAELKKEAQEVDLPDVWRAVFRKNKSEKEADTITVQRKKILISALPIIGYSLQTRFAILGVINGAFYMSKERKENISSVLINLTYSQNKQILFPIQSNIWTKGNKYNLTTDWRYWKYPSTTYGLGDRTQLKDGYLIDYSYLRFYQTLLRKIAPNLYAGLGYNLDYYWNVKEKDLPIGGKQTDFEKYGLTKKAVASGVTINLTYDKRRNSINPDKGYYAHLTYRPNFTFIGSDANWQSLILDLRKYAKLPFSSKNVLAFWSYSWLTTGGNPPYMLLPSTGTDVNNNTGRGYIQGRFRSKNMLYVETEYRFGITNNGLVGGVVFVNAQSVSDEVSNKFRTIYPGWGLGLRLKVNKYSRTNVAVDYGFGEGGSRGFFVNLGEIF